MLTKWFKRAFVLTLLSLAFAAGYKVGRIPREHRLRWAAALVRRWARRLLRHFSNLPVLEELRVIRTQNNRILGQNETIYRQNDRILGILVREFEARPAVRLPEHT